MATAKRTAIVVARTQRLLLRAAYRRPSVISLWTVVVAFLGVAVVASWHLGIPIRDPEGTLLGKRIVLPLVFMFIFFGLDVAFRARSVWRRGHVTPYRATIDLFIQRWWWQRIVLAIMGFMAFHATYLAYRNLKSWTQLYSYWTHDNRLIDLDRTMAFGYNPAQLLHDLLGTGIAAHILSSVYLAFLPFVPISVAAALTFVNRIRDGYVYVAATVYCWILGTISYYLIPSLGPFGHSQAFGGSSRMFTDLPITGVSQLQHSLIGQRQDLIADPVGSGLVQSIGGFASLHVGIVFMALLMTRYYKHRGLELAAWAFLIPTTIATIYFGWHYLIDDIAGFGIGYLAVTWGRWTIYPRAIPVVAFIERRRARGTSVTAEI